MNSATLYRPDFDLPPALAADLQEFESHLRTLGAHAALVFLNGRTPHRFTGVYRFDGEMLRNVLLVDKWDPSVTQGEDVLLSQAYCAVLHDTGEPLEVLDSRTDGRFPHMRESPIVSYCGALIRDAEGEPWGALCHYDLQPCQVKTSDMPLLVAATAPLYAAVQEYGSAGCDNTAP